MLRPRKSLPHRAPQSVPEGFVKAVPTTAFFALLGRYYIRPTEGAAPVFGLHVRPKHVNRYATAHGGFLATLFDAGMAAHIRHYAPGLTGMRTKTLTVEYKRPVPLGAWIEIHGAGYSQMTTERGERAEVVLEIRGNGKMLARAMGLFAVFF